MPDTRSDFFDAHAPRWDARRPPDMPRRLERVVREAGIPAGARVLDLGCGTGVLVPHLLDRIGTRGWIVAVDNSREMLRRAQEKGFSPRVALVQADAQSLPFAACSFDAVFCNAALPHFPDRKAAIGEMARVLRPGGAIVISHPIGRDAVNRLHRETGGAVGEDRVPPAGRLCEWLKEAGMIELRSVDEPQFYLVSGRRGDRHRAG